MLRLPRLQLSMSAFLLFFSLDPLLSSALGLQNDRHSFCHEPQAFELGQSPKSAYEFEVSILCLIPGRRSVFPNLSKPMMSSFRADGRYTIEKVEKITTEDGLQGYRFNASERNELSYGSVSIHSEAQLLGGLGILLFSLKSDRIDASRYAKYTVSQTLDRLWSQNLSYQVDFKTTKTVKIRKPKLAPESIFVKAVLRGLKDEIVEDSYEMIARFEAI